MTKHSHITIGYLQSQLIRTPLHLNSEWNTKVNESDFHELMNLSLTFEVTVEELTSISYATSLYLDNKLTSNE